MVKFPRPTMRAAVITTACVIEAAALASLVYRAGTAPLAPTSAHDDDPDRRIDRSTHRGAPQLASVREVLLTSRAS